MPILGHASVHVEMYHICPHHECAHIRPFSAIFRFLGLTGTIFSLTVHPSGMDQWRIYGMMLMHICAHDSHATWMARCQHSQGASPS